MDTDKATTQLHTLLRKVLMPGLPVEFGQFRGEHGISPIGLLRQVNLYPEVFKESVTVTGKPTITLLEGAPSVEDVIDCQVLLAAIRKGSVNGVTLAALYKHTSIPSKRIESLLKGRVDRKTAGKKVYFRVKDSADPGPEEPQETVCEPPGTLRASETGKESLDQTNAPLGGHVALVPEVDLERARDRLVELCTGATRNSHWLENWYFEAGLLRRVLERYRDDFREAKF